MPQPDALDALDLVEQGLGARNSPLEQQSAHHHQQHSSKSVKIDRFLWLRRIFLLALIFTASLSMLVALLFSLARVNSTSLGRGGGGGWEFIEISREQQQQLLNLRFPRNIDELRSLREALGNYQQQHRQLIKLGIICLYLFLQAFMLPGSIFLNILAGSFYSFFEALFLVTVLATLGSSLCYMLSRFILRDIVYYYFPERCDRLAKEVHSHRHNLLNYVLFLRITPLLPNWFINVASPLAAVPFREFFLGTFVGVIPAGVVAVKAGRILSQLNSLNDLYDSRTLAALFFLAFLVILPVVFKRRELRNAAKAT
ncbi:transmembrane protein 41B [Selaginella moellendorffii]|nr:transmembrane protein 41B [Selaginella moellendorffii]|eukprot:XP_002987352.2 transmembrane protein 41B [Selaginella moellendorffii]